jgi:hypothetical protein
VVYSFVEKRPAHRQDKGVKMLKRALKQSEPSADRRVTHRLPIEREVRYKVIGGKQPVRPAGSGKTLNMSSGGVLFTTESDLPEGARVEIAVSWPAQLNGATPLKLVATGVLVRSEEKRAAISIQSYEFRTRGLSL